MKRILISFATILTAVCAQAGVLNDKFQAFISHDGVSVTDVTKDFASGMPVKKAYMAIPTAGPEMFAFPILFADFHKSLPANTRLNVGELEDGEPEVYYYQPSVNSDAEIIMIMYSGMGINAVNYLIMPAAEGLEFKKSALSTVGKVEENENIDSEEVVVDSRGELVGSYCGTEGNNYIAFTQDYVTVPKAGHKIVKYSAEAGQGVLTCKNPGVVNVRSIPSTSGEIVGRMICEEGDLPDCYDCLGKQNGWYKVRVGNRIGYVRQDLVTWDAFCGY